MTRRRIAHLAAVALVLLAIAACSDDDDGGDSATDGDAAGTVEEGTAQEGGDLLNQALAAHVNGDLEGAETLYRQLLEQEPGNKYALYNLGLLAQQSGNPAEAEQHYRQALAIDPQYGPALFNLAILRTEAAPEEAESLYRTTIEVNPADAAAHLNLGFLLIGQGRQDEGDAEIAEAIRLDPSLASRVVAPQGETTEPAGEGEGEG